MVPLSFGQFRFGYPPFSGRHTLLTSFWFYFDKPISLLSHYSIFLFTMSISALSLRPGKGGDTQHFSLAAAVPNPAR